MRSGRTRIALLRLLQEQPGKNVTQFAEAAGIGISDASQELRRIQSRGLLRSKYCGTSVVYSFGADPQVPSALPLLKAIRLVLSTTDPDQDDQIHLIADGLAHPRRIEIMRALLQTPETAYELHRKLNISHRSIGRHIQRLLDSGMIQRKQRILHSVRAVHPLAKVLIRLLPK